MAANNNNRDTEADKLLEELKQKLKDGNVSSGAVAPEYLEKVRVGSLKLARQRQLADEDKKRKLEGNSAPAAAEKDEVAEKTHGKIHRGGRRRKTKRKSKRKRKHKRKTRSHKGGRKRTRRHKHKRKTKRRRTKRRRRR